MVLEATGAYHLPLLSIFLDKKIFVSIINLLVMKKYASTAIRKGKTDKIDFIRIANYGIDNWFHLTKHEVNEDTYEELRFLGRQYSHYIKIKIDSMFALTSILDRTMPGIKKLLSGKRSDNPTKDKLSDFVEHYWHYDNITKLTESKFVESYQKWAKKKRYHASESKARKIYAMACSGIPTLPSRTPSTKMLVDVKRFHSASALIAYAGLDSPPYESGSFIGTRRKISKRSSSLLRKTGY